MPNELIYEFIVFSLFVFYQQLYTTLLPNGLRCILLGASSKLLMVYGSIFLLAWAFQVSVLQALGLFAASYIFKMLIFFIEARLRVEKLFYILTLWSLVFLPILGVKLWGYLPS